MILIHANSTLAFMAVTFVVQALSHFVINQAHFASISHLRADPIIPMGLAAMVIQGLVLSLALQAWRRDSASVTDGLKVATAFGLFLTAYISLAEPAKYRVPDVGGWISVEITAAVVQFILFGIALGLIHSRKGGVPSKQP